MKRNNKLGKLKTQKLIKALDPGHKTFGWNMKNQYKLSLKNNENVVLENTSIDQFENPKKSEYEESIKNNNLETNNSMQD